MRWGGDQVDPPWTPDRPRYGLMRLTLSHIADYRTLGLALSCSTQGPLGGLLGLDAVVFARLAVALPELVDVLLVLTLALASGDGAEDGSDVGLGNARREKAGLDVGLEGGDALF